MTRRRSLGAGTALPDPPVRDPRARTAAERAADAAWVELPAGGPAVPPGVRRRLGSGGGTDHQAAPPDPPTAPEPDHGK
ncbi:hypothetical protein ACFPRH_35450 [Streptomyces amakusaensis]|uniref:Uncharacterized protein n=1 Tax=Streptomyces amakusaensis TaxID=67271 RepID=A0ABW0AW48_9ACTN